MSKVLDLKDQLDEESAKLRVAIEYVLPIIRKNADFSEQVEYGINLIVRNFLDKIKELWAFLDEVERGRNFKPIEADLIGFCSHKNCAYDNGPVKEHNYCLECPSRYTKDENGNLRDKNGEIISVAPEAIAKEPAAETD